MESLLVKFTMFSNVFLMKKKDEFHGSIHVKCKYLIWTYT